MHILKLRACGPFTGFYKKTYNFCVYHSYCMYVYQVCTWYLHIQGVANTLVIVSIFTKLVSSYPMVAKSLRDIRKGHHHHQENHHCCGMTLREHGLGYADLDELMQKPQSLEFIIGRTFEDVRCIMYSICEFLFYNIY